jgi:hypothetical protein
MILKRNVKENHRSILFDFDARKGNLLFFSHRKRKTIARSDSENENGEPVKRKKKTSHKKRSSRATANDDEGSQNEEQQLSDNEQVENESEEEEKPKRKSTSKKTVKKWIEIILIFYFCFSSRAERNVQVHQKYIRS